MFYLQGYGVGTTGEMRVTAKPQEILLLPQALATPQKIATLLALFCTVWYNDVHDI